MRNILLMIVVTLCCDSVAATPLTKEDHAMLAGQTMESCLSSQARQPANQNLTIAKLQDFCRCFGEGVASGMQVEDVAKNQDTISPELIKASDTASKKCAAATLSK